MCMCLICPYSTPVWHGLPGTYLPVYCQRIATPSWGYHMDASAVRWTASSCIDSGRCSQCSQCSCGKLGWVNGQTISSRVACERAQTIMLHADEQNRYDFHCCPDFVRCLTPFDEVSVLCDCETSASGAIEAHQVAVQVARALGAGQQQTYC